MLETAKNFFGSCVSAERLTTVEYPEQRLPLAENARVFPFLVYDAENRDGGGPEWEAGLRCVSCQICEKECPPKCIYIEKSKDPGGLGRFCGRARDRRSRDRGRRGRAGRGRARGRRCGDRDSDRGNRADRARGGCIGACDGNRGCCCGRACCG